MRAPPSSGAPRTRGGRGARRTALSREVLGDGAEVQGDVRDDDAPSWALPRQSVADLDAPDVDAGPDPADGPPEGPSGTTPPEGARSGVELPDWLTRPLGVGLAVVAALLVGVLVAAGVSERTVTAERRSTARLLASMTWPENSGPDGVLSLRLVVVNAGPEPVTVTEARLEGSRSDLQLSESVQVPAGRSRSVEAVLRTDCSSRQPGTLVLLATTADGRSREVTAEDTGRGLGMPPGEIATFCDQPPSLEPIPVWRTAVDDDGALSLQLRNTRGQPATLTALGPPGTTVTGEPALPASLPTDRSAVVRLFVEVDRCTSAAQRADAGAQVELLLDGEPGLVQVDHTTLVGWFAQQVARACG